jgi:hypothetical protein
MLGIYRVAAQLVASRVVLSSIELVSYVDTIQGISPMVTSILTVIWCQALYKCF